MIILFKKEDEKVLRNHGEITLLNAKPRQKNNINKKISQ